MTRADQTPLPPPPQLQAVALPTLLCVAYENNRACDCLEEQLSPLVLLAFVREQRQQLLGQGGEQQQLEGAKEQQQQQEQQLEGSEEQRQQLLGRGGEQPQLEGAKEQQEQQLEGSNEQRQQEEGGQQQPAQAGRAAGGLAATLARIVGSGGAIAALAAAPQFALAQRFPLELLPEAEAFLEARLEEGQLHGDHSPAGLWRSD